MPSQAPEIIIPTGGTTFPNSTSGPTSLSEAILLTISQGVPPNPMATISPGYTSTRSHTVRMILPDRRTRITIRETKNKARINKNRKNELN
jgi:hypothetical protein